MNNKKKSGGKKLTLTQHLPDFGCGTLPTTVLTLIKADDAESKINFQVMCGSKHTLGGPINYRALNLSLKIAKVKRNWMHVCTTFSASRLFHHFLMCARSGSAPYHNALTNNISSDCTSKYIEGLVHSICDKDFSLLAVLTIFKFVTFLSNKITIKQLSKTDGLFANNKISYELTNSAPSFLM